MEINDLLEPNKVYDKQLAEAHHQNAIEWYEELTQKANTNVEANRATCKELYKTQGEIKGINKKISKYKVGRGFAILMLIVGILAAAGAIYLGIVQGIQLKETTRILIGAGVTVAGIGMFIGAIFIIKHCNKLIKNAEEILRKLEEKAKRLEDEAWGQMYTLNCEFDYNMGGRLVKRSAPLLQFDETFDIKKYKYLVDRYGLGPNDDPNISTIDCLTGSILGNPFIFEREYEMEMGTATYRNSITIRWTTYTYDSEGHSIPQHHTQTLTAEITKPKPYYYTNTWLIYGNEAAPDLKFSRRPSKINEFKDQNAINKYVKKHEKDLQKKSEEALKKNKTFTPLSNTEFELFFGALDRNNEVQYRLLFTPLGQKSMLDLIKDPYPFGDDFTFIKSYKLNLIRSEHMQGANIFAGPSFFYGFDYDKVKENFIAYHDEFLKNIFFDLAPLLCIPLYQQHKDITYIYPDFFESNTSCYEHEVMANKFNKDLISHPLTKTPVIVKTNLMNSVGDVDNVSITAHSFDEIERVEIVTKLGGDGYYHDIPVTWYEYIPLTNYSTMAIRQYNESLQEMRELQDSNKDFASFISKNTKNNGIIFQRGLLSFLTEGKISQGSVDQLRTFFKK